MEMGSHIPDLDYGDISGGIGESSAMLNDTIVTSDVKVELLVVQVDSEGLSDLFEKSVSLVGQSGCRVLVPLTLSFFRPGTILLLSILRFVFLLLGRIVAYWLSTLFSIFLLILRLRLLDKTVCLSADLAGSRGLRLSRVLAVLLIFPFLLLRPFVALWLGRFVCRSRVGNLDLLVFLFILLGGGRFGRGALRFRFGVALVVLDRRRWGVMGLGITERESEVGQDEVRSFVGEPFFPGFEAHRLLVWQRGEDSWQFHFFPNGVSIFVGEGSISGLGLHTGHPPTLDFSFRERLGRFVEHRLNVCGEVDEILYCFDLFDSIFHLLLIEGDDGARVCLHVIEQRSQYGLIRACVVDIDVESWKFAYVLFNNFY